MNERFKELAHQADFINKRHNGDDWRWGWIDPELNIKLEKFAELLINECAEFSRQHNLENADRSHMIHKAIKAHFGVQ